jgi:hypothetical protein
MGRKSRKKKERGIDGVRRAPRDGAAERSAGARTRAVADVAAADPGPHSLLPDRLHARRLELRDDLAANSASLWASAGLLAELVGGARGERAFDLDYYVLHDLDARIAWEALLGAQDADPDAVPDEQLCQVVADCEWVERGAQLDPLRAGIWAVSQELVDRLNVTSSPEGSAADLAGELAATERLVGGRLGEPARSLLRYLAAETTLDYHYPPGSWPVVEDLPGGLSDGEGALGTWAAEEGIGRPEAVSLATRLAPVLSQISRGRFTPPAS